MTTDPTKIMWMHLISLEGGLVKRLPVRCKATSSGKRFEPSSVDVGAVTINDRKEKLRAYGPKYGNYRTTELIGPDGTYGSSGNYVYWFDPIGRYHQLGTAGGLGYLLTDYPIDIENPLDTVTGLYNIHEAAAKWQEEQKAQLEQQKTVVNLGEAHETKRLFIRRCDPLS